MENLRATTLSRTIRKSINHKLNLNQSSSLSIAKLFMALSYARVNFSNANLALVQYLGAHPDASTKGHELYTDYRVLAERLHRERRTYLKCACNTLAQVIERMKRSSGANIIINTNIKLMVDQDNYITVMRSDNSNLLRAVDDKQPLILRENELLHEFSRAPLSYLKVDDISEEYINVKSRHRSFRFPNISSVAFYRSCLIVPIHGTMPRFDTSDHQKISDVPVTIAYLMANSTDLAVFNEDFDLSVMTQLANYIFSMYTEYWSAVSGAGEIQS